MRAKTSSWMQMAGLGVVAALVAVGPGAVPAGAGQPESPLGSAAPVKIAQAGPGPGSSAGVQIESSRRGGPAWGTAPDAGGGWHRPQGPDWQHDRPRPYHPHPTWGSYPYRPYRPYGPWWGPPGPVWVPGQWVWTGWTWVWQPGYWW